ncbi:MAG: hypothetical protein IT282_17380 [Bacteroidetes bacterium]|nr:hypothetical protein [Bacteroidota bacterium]
MFHLLIGRDLGERAVGHPDSTYKPWCEDDGSGGMMNRNGCSGPIDEETFARSMHLNLFIFQPNPDTWRNMSAIGFTSVQAVHKNDEFCIAIGLLADIETNAPFRQSIAFIHGAPSINRTSKTVLPDLASTLDWADENNDSARKGHCLFEPDKKS